MSQSVAVGAVGIALVVGGLVACVIVVALDARQMRRHKREMRKLAYAHDRERILYLTDVASALDSLAADGGDPAETEARPTDGLSVRERAAEQLLSESGVATHSGHGVKRPEDDP